MPYAADRNNGTSLGHSFSLPESTNFNVMRFV